MSTTFTFTVISVSTLCSYCMNCYCLDHASIVFPCFKGVFSSSQFEFYSIVKLLSACIQIGNIEIRVSRFLYTSLGRNSSRDQYKKQETLFLLTCITYTSFGKRETPKLVFYPTYHRENGKRLSKRKHPTHDISRSD